jgi:cell division protein FtsQ
VILIAWCRKLSCGMRKRWINILRLVTWVFLLAYLVVVFGFVKKKAHNQPCQNIQFSINSEHAFVDTIDIIEMLKPNSLYPLGKTLSEINLLKIENCIETNEAVRDAEVYSDLSGTVYIEVLQRNPVLRIISLSNQHYYVDEDFGLMTVGYDYTADVPVMSGFISDTLIQSFKRGNDSLRMSGSMLDMRSLIAFADFLYRDELWRDLFVQIYVNEKFEIELVPRVGHHIIILGTLEDYKYKMKKLKAMYKKAFPHYGWNQYKTINLKYSNQVVCSKY